MPICPYAKKIREDYEDIGLPMVFCEQLQQRVITSVFPCYKEFETCKYYKPIVTIKPLEAIKAKKRNCMTCVYYSEFSKRCLKMNIEISDPNKPPCEKAGGGTLEDTNLSTENPISKNESEKEESTKKELNLAVFRFFKKRRRQRVS